MDKLIWQGTITSIQPRIRLLRSFDQRNHNYLGYCLRINGTIAQEEREFLVGIGKGAQAKHQFKAECVVSGECLFVEDLRLETAEFYKVSKLKLLETSTESDNTPPPWLGVSPELEIYRQRGHCRLDARTYESKCTTCIWGCKMSVEMIIDQWNPSKKRYRVEAFCYGPKSCSFYKAGPARKVPGRKGMSYTEENWVDEDSVSHREIDD